ncbi:MAG: class I SAM-dependent methyltransferase [Parvularculaceae bacterium]|nr:class I SAM-dependent methyltransferase [Parvularculaceae bacterium]
MTTEERRWRDIWTYQAREIEGLASDRSLALRAGRRAHYSRIGDWLGPETAGRTLELGCGPGRYVALLSSLGHEVTGVDPHSFENWRTISARTGARFLSGVYAESLPFEDGAFDNVACLGAMLYFKDIDKALSELRRVTKKGGRAVFRTVNDRHLHTRVTGKRLDPAAPNYFSEHTLRTTLERHGFAVKRQFAYGVFPPFGDKTWWWLINGKLPIAFQEAISGATPASLRVNLMAFATVE